MGFETYQRILSEAFLEIKQESYNNGIELKEAKKGVKNEEKFNEAINNKTDYQYITECTIDTDHQLLIPDSYIPQTSEKIRLYKELDAMSREEDIVKFTEDLIDRFGQMPEELRQLTYIVRLRREAVKLGFERLKIKNGIMIIHFVNNQQSPYYKSQIFAEILKYISENPKLFGNLRENNGRLVVSVRGVSNIEVAYNVVYKMKISIFARL